MVLQNLFSNKMAASSFSREMEYGLSDHAPYLSTRIYLMLAAIPSALWISLISAPAGDFIAAS